MFTKTDIDHYFLSYRQEHLFLLLIAAAAFVTAVIFYFVIKKQFYKGLAISLISFAILFFTTSYTAFKRADRLRVVNTYSYDLHPEYLKGKEMKRIGMLKNTTNIEVYTSIALILLSIGLYVYAAKKPYAAYLRGIAVGACMMATIAAITFNIIRTNLLKYEKGIVEFTKEIMV
jgi:hypothetical protein